MNDDVIKTKRKTLLQMVFLAFECLMLPSSIRVLVWNIDRSCYLWLFNCYWLSNISQLEQRVISFGYKNDTYSISNLDDWMVWHVHRFSRLRYLFEKSWLRINYWLLLNCNVDSTLDESFKFLEWKKTFWPSNFTMCKVCKTFG